MTILKSVRRLPILLVIAMALGLVACSNDSGTQPQVFDVVTALRSLTLSSQFTDDGDVAVVATAVSDTGMPAAGVPISFTTSSGEFLSGGAAVTDSDGRASVVLRSIDDATVHASALGTDSPALLTTKGAIRLTFDLRGPPRTADARETERVLVKAAGPGGKPVTGTLFVDFGDDRTQELAFDRRLELEHIYRAAGTYRIKVVLIGSDGLRGQGSFRIRVGDKVKTTVAVSGTSSVKPGEAARLNFAAVRSDREVVRGTLTVDWDDGETQEFDDFVARLSRRHVYEEGGEYTVTASLAAANGQEAEGTFEVIAREGGRGGDEIDMRTVTSLHAGDIADWAITSQVTGTRVNTNEVCVFHTKAGQWPVFNGAEGNPWVVAKVAGRYYAATYEWLRPGQVCKGITASNIGQHIKQAPLGSWRPKKGEIVYLFYSTISRFSERTSNERTNVVELVWPY